MKTPLLRILATGLLSGMLALPSANADEIDPEITRLLKLRLGIDQIEPPRETGVDGVYQTRFGNKFAYLIEGGRYVFIGDMVDLQEARNLTEQSRRELVVASLAEFPVAKRIVFPAADEELAVLNVFTDTSCGYCQQLHKEVGYLQDAGISVHYYPYPRGGSRGPGYQDLKQVWCAEDPLAAMGIAKGVESGSLDGNTDCAAAEFVDEGYRLGGLLGLQGTPALYTQNGSAFAGYVPYQRLIPQLLNE